MKFNIQLYLRLIFQDFLASVDHIYHSTIYSDRNLKANTTKPILTLVTNSVEGYFCSILLRKVIQTGLWVLLRQNIMFKVNLCPSICVRFTDNQNVQGNFVRTSKKYWLDKQTRRDNFQTVELLINRFFLLEFPIFLTLW